MIYMIEINSLYEMVEAKLGTEYTDIFWDRMDEDTEETVYVNLYDSADDELNIDGSVVRKFAKAQITVVSGADEAKINKAKQYLEAFVDSIESCVSDIPEIYIINAYHRGLKAKPFKLNKNGIQMYYSVVNIEYNLN